MSKIQKTYILVKKERYIANKRLILLKTLIPFIQYNKKDEKTRMKNSTEGRFLLVELLRHYDDHKYHDINLKRLNENNKNTTTCKK